MSSLNELQMQAAIAQIQSKHKTNHVLHIILCFLTLGVWFPIWILVSISNAIERKKVADKAYRS